MHSALQPSQCDLAKLRQPCALLGCIMSQRVILHVVLPRAALVESTYTRWCGLQTVCRLRLLPRERTGKPPSQGEQTLIKLHQPDQCASISPFLKTKPTLIYHTGGADTHFVRILNHHVRSCLHRKCSRNISVKIKLRASL